MAADEWSKINEESNLPYIFFIRQFDRQYCYSAREEPAFLEYLWIRKILNECNTDGDYKFVTKKLKRLSKADRSKAINDPQTIQTL